MQPLFICHCESYFATMILAISTFSLVLIFTKYITYFIFFKFSGRGID